MKRKEYKTNPLFQVFLKIKYAFLGKFLPSPQPEGHHPGFILIQIDGISYPVLVKAMEKGYTPTMAKLINKNGYRLSHYQCPMPSNTPYVQAGMMYGYNKGIPGFRWLEKKKGLSVTFKEASSAALIEERISKKRIGILKGGSSYLNLFTGGAERSVFTLSTFAASNLLKKKKLPQLDIFILFFLYASNLVRTSAYIIIDLCLEIFEWIAVLLLRKKRRREGIFPLIRLINNVICREVETAGAMTDIIRGVPSVHLTYNGYDEISHHRGPEFTGSLRVLRGIDRKLKKIIHATNSGKKRKYDIYIFSDHGQTASTPFLHKYGETLAHFIQKTTPEELEIMEFNSPQEVVLYEGRKYMNELALLTLNVPRLLYNLFDIVRAWSLKNEPKALPFLWKEEKEQVFVNDSGPLAHIYFNFKKNKIPFEEIETKYPEFVKSLLSHEGIGVVTAHSSSGKPTIVKWDKHLKEEDKEQFLRLADDENAGDIIVQGAFDGKEIINFEEQLSGHGGLGGGQNEPFFLLPPDSLLDPSSINDPKDLYHFFFENYTKNVIKR
ncbi:MAG: alkaline phosphatase family protein [Proteobacteria bacterium]|nr:alkaline phosphatase family protein [Pseudomonadota bacterium]